jgi:Skp family chaperone for outer membrane proteins
MPTGAFFNKDLRMLHLLAAPLLLISQLATLPGIAPAGKDEGDAQPKTGTVAIVDLDLVSKQVGWAAEIDDDRKAAAAEVNSQFTVYVASVQNAWSAERKAIGQAANLDPEQLQVITSARIDGEAFRKLPLTRDQREQFLRCANEVSQALSSAREIAKETLSKREARVVDSYREAMKPSVRRVAKAAGISVVIPPNTAFYYDPSADISDQVVEELRKQMPEHTMPAMPKLNWPDFRFSGAAVPPDHGSREHPTTDVSE